jgi:hypothetical protein
MIHAASSIGDACPTRINNTRISAGIRNCATNCRPGSCLGVTLALMTPPHVPAPSFSDLSEPLALNSSVWTSREGRQEPCPFHCDRRSLEDRKAQEVTRLMSVAVLVLQICSTTHGCRKTNYDHSMNELAGTVSPASLKHSHPDHAGRPPPGTGTVVRCS